MGEPPPQPIEPLKIENLGEGLDARIELRWELRQRIGEAALARAGSYEALARLARSQFDATSSPAELDAFCTAVLVKLEPAWRSSPMPGTEQFVRAVLGLEEPASARREALLEQALADNRHLEVLISYYEGEAAVIAYREGRRPRNDVERTHVAFYDRCLQERADISRYLATGLDTEAIRLCSEDYRFLRHIDTFIELRYPSPYRLRTPRGQEHLDHRRINPWRHRVRFLPIELGRELGAVYESDPGKFYEELAHHRSTSDLLDIIDDAARRIDRLKSRQSIFAELRSLHDENLWLGFFALAIPQVEGLFAEMGDLAAPKAPLFGALPAKVKFVRRYAAVHEQNLDYFEFLVPIKRNQFSHIGKVEDPRLQSLEVLHDLVYVCEVYLELEAPVVELARLLKTIEASDKAIMRDWAHIFELLKEVDKRGQRADIASTLEETLGKTFATEEAKIAAAISLSKRLEDGALILRDHLRSYSQERLHLEVDISLPKLSREVVERSDWIVELMDDIEALNERFFEPLDVWKTAVGLLANVKFPPEARVKLESALKAVKTPLRNLESIIKLGESASDRSQR